MGVYASRLLLSHLYTQSGRLDPAALEIVTGLITPPPQSGIKRRYTYGGKVGDEDSRGIDLLAKRLKEGHKGLWPASKDFFLDPFPKENVVKPNLFPINIYDILFLKQSYRLLH